MDLVLLSKKNKKEKKGKQMDQHERTCILLARVNKSVVSLYMTFQACVGFSKKCGISRISVTGPAAKLFHYRVQ